MSDPLFGKTWKADPGKSLFSTDWRPDSETRLYEETAGGYRLTVSGTRNGEPYSWSYAAQYDGKDHAVSGREDADSIEAYRVNDRITIGFFKKKLVAAGAYTRQMSDDGKTLVVQAAGLRVDGMPYFDVIEYRAD